METTFVLQRAPFREIPKGHRLYNSLLKLVVAIDTIMIALLCAHDPEMAINTARRFTFSPAGGDPSFQIDTSVPTLLVFQDIEPDELVFRHMTDAVIAEQKLLDSQLAPPSQELIDNLQPQVPRLSLYFRFLNETSASSFLTFFENYNEWLRRNVSTDPNQWPEILRFARTIRNAVAHGGAINWDNPNPAINPVKWRNFEFSHIDNKRMIMGISFHQVDILLLMFDVSDELDKLVVPDLA